MAAEESFREDPLVAALPPATDYITYLTLLEYQLNAQNLPTLNRLLGEDDGTLAAEIGWDLLKMVLPMLQVVPDDATKCLEIISRRGNPREVIVRVAEELERLGQQDESEDDSEAEEEELPTFAGEAKRIHLGDMKLDGMPEHSPVPAKAVNDPVHGAVSEVAESGSDDSISLNALISMLGVLHPRIKTQHPSRFLATSLPAALGAYRRMPITEETTSNFLSLLGKLSGKQRPVLPPRISTSEGAASLLATKQVAASSTAPLPDPEGSTEEVEAIKVTQRNETAIINRLLQAVLLEVVDEYTNSFIAHDVMQMQWTNRLRERVQPAKVVPGRPSILQIWADNKELEARDKTFRRILKLASDLSLNVEVEVQQELVSKREIKTSTKEGEEANDEDDDEVTEYPRTPADVPISLSALVILLAAKQFYATGLPESATLETPIACLAELDAMALLHALPTTDAVLSLIYVPLFAGSPKSSTEILSQSEMQKPLKELEEIFISNPDASIRDNAHHIARGIFHLTADQDTKLTYIKQLLTTASAEGNAISSIQSGNLKSIAVNWLKDEFLSSTKGEPTQALSPELLSTDAQLQSLLFPSLPSMPGPFISSHPPESSSATSKEPNMPMSTEQDLETFLLHIPFYISSLNLITILSTISPHNDHAAQPHDTDPASSSAAATIDTKPTTNPSSSQQPNTPHDNNDEDDESILIQTPDLAQRATSFVQTQQTWQTGLLALLEARSTSNPNHASPLDVSDVYALEDAVGRAEKALSSTLTHG